MKILVVSSSRADFGLLLPVMRELNLDDHFEVEVCEIGSHISKIPENSIAFKEAGFDHLSLEVDTSLTDSEVSKTALVNSVLSNLTKYFVNSSLDAILVLGDRYETLAIAYAATLSNIPIIHLVGGDLTSGSLDDSYRHAITKLSRVHFATNLDSFNRILQLGENPEFVYISGSPGLDDLDKINYASKEELEKLLGIKFKSKIILVTFHPDSNMPDKIRAQVSELILALQDFCQNSTIVITGSNYDSGFTTINEMFQEFEAIFPNSVRFIEALGTRNYLSMMKLASAMVGNSSSGYYEAPSFSLPVVDLGDRQKGRIPHQLLENVPILHEHISSHIQNALELKPINILNPYWSGKSSIKVRDFLKNIPLDKLKSPKDFITLESKE